MGDWVIAPRQPNLNEPRYWHASTSTLSAAFVYGGWDTNGNNIGTVERLPLNNERDG